MKYRNSTASGGIGLSGITFIVFLILKLCEVIDWSWWWVTAPLWIPVALVVCVCTIIFIIGFCIGIVRASIKLIKEKRNGN